MSAVTLTPGATSLAIGLAAIIDAGIPPSYEAAQLGAMSVDGDEQRPPQK